MLSFTTALLLLWMRLASASTASIRALVDGVDFVQMLEPWGPDNRKWARTKARREKRLAGRSQAEDPMLLEDGMDCQPSSSWLGVQQTVQGCEDACLASDPSAKRIVWVKGGDKNCKCADADCTMTTVAEMAVYMIQAPPRPEEENGDVQFNDDPRAVLLRTKALLNVVPDANTAKKNVGRILRTKAKEQRQARAEEKRRAMMEKETQTKAMAEAKSLALKEKTEKAATLKKKTADARKAAAAARREEAAAKKRRDAEKREELHDMVAETVRQQIVAQLQGIKEPSQPSLDEDKAKKPGKKQVNKAHQKVNRSEKEVKLVSNKNKQQEEEVPKKKKTRGSAKTSALLKRAKTKTPKHAIALTKADQVGEKESSSAKFAASVYALRHNRSLVSAEVGLDSEDFGAQASTELDGNGQAAPEVVWERAGCTQRLPNATRSVDEDIATSHDADKQRQCYGHAAGDSVAAGDSPQRTSILGSAGVRRVECDEVKGLQFRQTHNLTADASAQQQKKVLFSQVVSAFKKMGVPVIMSSGLMLGWWRECDFLTHDNDIDLNVFHRTLPQDFAQRLGESGLDVLIRVPQHAQFQNIHDNMGLELTVKSSGADSEIWCNVFVVEEGQITMKPNGQNQLSFMQPIWAKPTALWNCTSTFESLALTNWQGVDVFVPYPPEVHLIGKYGPTWNHYLPSDWPVYSDCDLHNTVEKQPWTRRWDITDMDKFIAAVDVEQAPAQTLH